MSPGGGSREDGPLGGSDCGLESGGSPWPGWPLVRAG